MRGVAGAAMMAVFCTFSCADPACKEYVSTADLSAPATLRGDVLPIFAASCTLTSCHGVLTGQNQGLYLGSRTMTTDPVQVRTNLLAVSATAGFPYVTPGDPKRSFLMRKLDGDQCTLDTSCANHSCGARMPRGLAELPAAQRDTIRRWIAQGAKDN